MIGTIVTVVVVVVFVGSFVLLSVLSPDDPYTRR